MCKQIFINFISLIADNYGYPTYINPLIQVSKFNLVKNDVVKFRHSKLRNKWFCIGNIDTIESKDKIIYFITLREVEEPLPKVSYYLYNKPKIIERAQKIKTIELIES